MTYTKGPWSYVCNNWQYTTIYAPNGRPVAELNLEDWGVNEENQSELEVEQEQVARLISAAPELLEALNRLRACYSTSHSPQTRQDCWEQAFAAIAKATGETP